MNFLDFNTIPWYQWLVLAVVPPLIFLLYFLKLRRSPLQVPSTFLWTRTIEDMHVNSLWQRLRNNLLLWLQLFAVLLLALSCLRPGCRSEQLAGGRFVFVVDQSASMSATDLASKKSRLEEAKTLVKQTIDRMSGSDAGMLISFSDRAIVQQSYTTNRSLLKRKVDQIQQTERSSDISEALTAASGLANPGRTSDRESQIDLQVAEGRDTVLQIYSDGGVREVPRFSFGKLTAEYFPIGSFEVPSNVGITALSLNNQLESDGQIEAFTRLQNSGMEETAVDVSLYIDDELFDARAGVNVPGLGSTSISFDLSGVAGRVDQSIPIRVQIDSPDVYALDNVAHCVLNPPRLSSVLVVSEDEKYLQLAARTDRVKKLANVQFESPDFLKDQQYEKQTTLGFYDLIVFDQCAPEKMPACNTVFWGSLPVDEQWSKAGHSDVTPIVDVNNAHPLMQSVQMTTVNVLSSDFVKGPTGSTSLVDSVDGAVMMLAPRSGFLDLVIGFPLIQYDDAGEASVNTDWPRKLGFPIFMQNLFVTLGGQSQFGQSFNRKPGQLMNFRSRLPYPEVSVTGPDGKTETVAARTDNSFVFVNTEASGVYEIRPKDDQDVDQLIAVNLLDRRESDLAVAEKMELGYVEIEGTRSRVPVRREFWPWLVLAVIVVLMIEWLVYNRRVAI